MAKYTTEVRSICEYYAGESGSADYSLVEDVIEKSRGKIFDFAYPIFDDEYKIVLETKIIRHYYTREIGLETVGLWKLKLCTKMNEIMPYYNQLYKSTILEFNPFFDVDITTTHSGSFNGNKNVTGKMSENDVITGTSNSNGSNIKDTTGSNTGNVTNNETNNGTSLDKFSDTPQGSVTNLTDGTYLTNAREITNNTTGISSSESKSDATLKEKETTTDTNESTKNANKNTTDEKKETLKNTDEYLEKVSGKQGTQSYSKMLQEYRNTFLNIDIQVIDELSDLFLNLW